MTALEIFQDFLDSTAGCFIGGDFAAYRARVCLPFVLVTGERSYVFEDEDALRAQFDRFAAMLAEHRVTDLLRPAYNVGWMGPAMILGHYETHLVSGTRRAAPLFSSAMTLRREGRVWRAASAVNSTRSTDIPAVWAEQEELT